MLFVVFTYLNSGRTHWNYMHLNIKTLLCFLTYNQSHREDSLLYDSAIKSVFVRKVGCVRVRVIFSQSDNAAQAAEKLFFGLIQI